MKLDDFCQLDWNTANPHTIKEIIYSFQVSNEKNVLHGKQVTLDFIAIKKIFKLLMEGIVILVRKLYNKEWEEYFEERKEEHYKQDLGYILKKVCTFGMQI